MSDVMKMQLARMGVLFRDSVSGAPETADGTDLSVPTINPTTGEMSGLSKALAAMGVTSTGRTAPLRLGTFGDSTGAVGGTTSTTNQNMEKLVSATWGSSSFAGSVAADKYQVDRFYPKAYLVFNGGIGGQNTTQMLARDTSVASITRRAITDAINSKLDAVLLRAGSINDLLTVTPATLAATVAATYENHIAIINRFLAANIPVVDIGIYGFANGTANTATDLASTLSAITQLNALYAGYAATLPGKVMFASPVGVVSDSSGAYLPGMSNDGTHLNRWGQYQMASMEAAALSWRFGNSIGPRYLGPNLFTNSLFANVTSGLATGITRTATNATYGNEQIQIIDGKPWQTIDYTITGASNVSSITVSYTPQSYELSPGDVIGIELDISIEGLNGYSPTPTSILMRESTYYTGGSIYMLNDLMTATTSAESFPSKYKGHVVFTPTLFGGNAFGSNSYVTLSVFTNDTTGTLRLGVSCPRIVKLTDTTVVDEGSATLSSGTVTVTNSKIFPGAEIILSTISPSGTPGALSIGTITPFTSFVINSTSALDTSVVRWRINSFTG